jgi:hypothetical protein
VFTAMKGSRTDAFLAGLCALGPVCLAAAHLGNVPDAAHDGGVARVLALDPQAWRALDVVAGALLSAIPLGTRAARAALGDSLVLGGAGVAAYALARRLLGACAETRRLRFFVAAIAALTPLVAAPWQIEGAAVGGSVTGALLILAPLALLDLAVTDRAVERASVAPVAALALGLAIGHEPLVGACAAAACAALLASSAPARASLGAAWRARPLVLGGALLAGLGPLLVALLRVRATGAPLAGALASAWAGETGLSRGGSPLPFVGAEMGVVLTVLAACGVALAMLLPAARPLAAALVAMVLTGFGCAALGAPVGPTRFGAPVLAAFSAASVLAGVAMQAAVRAIASAKVPMARESAAMVIVLELALPAAMADEALVRASARASGAAAQWDDAVWGGLPPESVVLVTGPATYARAVAARATRSLRDDVTVVPTFLHDARAWRSLSGDASLVPLWRDLELVGVAGEASLSSLAAIRPLATAYEPRLGKTVGKHLVPVTLFDRFEPEPRGASDRRRALDTLAPLQDRLAHAVAGDAELQAAAADLLRARADLLVALSGDPDLVARTAADVRAFTAPAPGRFAPGR